MNKNHIRKIRQLLKDWYLIHKRTLPWRETNDPYKIWISEIILQQTRVNQGLDYYIHFIERFPDVKSLATADEMEVLKYWQGLGYYSRARNLHKAARKVVTDFDGKFPLTYSEVISLPGIGEYTASAICSFAFDHAHAAVDGNIFRVISRLVADATPIDTPKGKKFFTETAQMLLDIKSPGLHNQAIMEFGALQCTPVNPDCELCVLRDFCEADKRSLVNQLPVKQGKTKVTNRYFNYFFIKNSEFTYLQKRTAKDIWQNLYEFPLIETDRAMNIQELTETENFKQLFAECEITIGKISNPVKHILSHRIVNAVFYQVHIPSENERISTFLKIRTDELNHYAVSRLTERYLEQD